MTARFCLRCGRPLRVVRERGKRRQRCRACGWTFYNNPVPAAVAVIRRGRRILLTRRAAAPYAGTWDLPGGFIEAGEQPDRALRREIREELGLALTRVRLLSLDIDRYGRSGFPVLPITYEARVGPGRPRPSDDVSAAEWFAQGSLPYRSIAFRSVRRTLRAYVRTPGRGTATGRSRRARAHSS